jgi:hypothetical protein
VLENYLNDYDSMFDHLSSNDEKLQPDSQTTLTNTDAPNSADPAPSSGPLLHVADNTTESEEHVSSSSSSTSKEITSETNKQKESNTADSSKEVSVNRPQSGNPLFVRSVIHQSKHHYQHFLNLLAHRILSWKDTCSLWNNNSTAIPLSSSSSASASVSTPMAAAETASKSLFERYSHLFNPQTHEFQCPTSEFNLLQDDFDLIGCRIRLYNPLDHRYHTGRILAKRVKHFHINSDSNHQQQQSALASDTPTATSGIAVEQESESSSSIPMDVDVEMERSLEEPPAVQEESATSLPNTSSSTDSLDQPYPLIECLVHFRR